MKSFVSMTIVLMIAVALSACATVAPHKAAAVSTSPSTPGTTTITGEDLKRTGRTEPSDALRALSPLFH